MGKYTVLLVEDHPETRERLANAVREHPQLQLVAAVENCAIANKSLDEQTPDVMLTDLGLPDGSGLDLIRRVAAMQGNTEIMVITVFGDEKHVLSAIEAGASGYLLKDGTSDYIGDSIIQMMNGESPVSPAIARHLLKRFRTIQTKTTAKDTDSPKLTPRESEILQYVAKGFSFTEVANLINVSPHTVTHHIKNIYKKLAVCSRAEAVYEAMQLGLVRMDT
jgi:DNA-binding NarL/FixJ family response regulator